MVTLGDTTLKVSFLFVSYHKAIALLIATTVSTVLDLVIIGDTQTNRNYPICVVSPRLAKVYAALKATTVSAVLALVTIGNTTEIGRILFALCHPG